MFKGLLIIPVFNEEKNIGQVLTDILSSDINIDIVVINDGSKDETNEVIKRFDVPLISHPYNLGYGAALQTGFKYAKSKGYKYVIQFDGDGQHDIHYIPLMIKECNEGSYDIVIGSRYLEKGAFKAGILKGTVIYLMRFLVKHLSKKIITDPTSGFRGLSQRTYTFYSNMGNFPNDYPDADLLIQMLRAGYRLHEFPIKAKERIEGESMHSGLKPIIYLYKILLSIGIIILREKLLRRK